MVRAHIGKWISTQTQDRAAGSTVVPVDPPLVTSARPDAVFENDSDEPSLPSTDASSNLSSPSSQSSPGSDHSCSSQPAPLCLGSSRSQVETLAVVPRTPGHSNTDICHYCGFQKGCRCGLPESGIFMSRGKSIETVCRAPGPSSLLVCPGRREIVVFAVTLQPDFYTAFLFGSLSHMRVQALNGSIARSRADSVC
ncbi:hypothetical protein BDW72DRAFT_32595 [Aspergillus terricola var. indicus]